MARAARYDGVLPVLDPWTEQVTPQHVRDLAAFVGERRPDAGAFEIGVTYGPWSEDPKDDVGIAGEYRDAGATWYLEAAFPGLGSLERLSAHVRRGPPRG
jgi:hypothetical protein